MKKKSVAQPFKQALVAVSASALMLGASQAGTIIGLNFQGQYYSGAPAGVGAAYQTTGFPVTGKAFGVDAANWENSPLLPSTGKGGLYTYTTNFPLSTNFVISGTLTVNVTAPNVWMSGIGNLSTTATAFVAPGNDEVTWTYLTDGAGGPWNLSGKAPAVSISGLAAEFPHGYVVETIASVKGTANFNNVDFSDGTTAQNGVVYSNYLAGVGTKTTGSAGYAISGEFTGDTLNIHPEPQTAGNRSTLAGFIINDQPRMTQDPIGSSSVTGGSFALSAGFVGITNNLYCQWQLNGANVPGATNLTYAKTGVTVADSGDYTLVVTNLAGSVTSAVATVFIYPVTPPANSVVWTGSGNGTWDINLTPNWESNGVATTYADGSAVQFDDTAATTVISNTATVHPFAITVNNSVQDYTIGVPIDGVTTLTKLGSGNLTLPDTNTFTGATVLGGGLLSVPAAGLPETSALTLSNNATLLVTTAGTLSNNVTIAAGQTGTLAVGSNGGYFAVNLAGDFSGVAGTLIVDTTASTNAYKGYAASTSRGPVGTVSFVTGSLFGQLAVSGAASNFLSQAKLVLPDSGQVYVQCGNDGGLAAGVQFGSLSGGAGGSILSADNRVGFFYIINGLVDGDFGGYIQNGGGAGANNVIKTGPSTQTFSGQNTYTGTTTVKQGTLLVNGSLSASSAVTVTNATLAGSGGIGGSVTVQNGGVLEGSGSVGGAVIVQRGGIVAGTESLSGPSVEVQGGGVLEDNVNISGATAIDNGGVISPGTEAGVGTISLFNVLTLNPGSTNLMRISKTGGALASDFVSGMTGVNYGGVLNVLNITSDGNMLADGDIFTLFNSTAYYGSFAVINLPALPAGLSWNLDNLSVDGSIKVGTQVTTPTFNPVGGGFPGSVGVTISSLTAGATIHYTTDGSDPTTSGTAVSGPSPLSGIIIPANTNVTVRAYASESGYANSSVASSTYITIPQLTWVNPNGGNWPDTINWTNGFVAGGSGVTADFSTLTLPAGNDMSVFLNGARTIGGMVFGDQANATSTDLEPGSPIGTLTLDASTPPVIAVINQQALIDVNLAGTNGVAKSGPGKLVLRGTNTYTGNTMLGDGTLSISNAANLPSGSAMTLTNGAVLEVRATMTMANKVSLPAGQAGAFHAVGPAVSTLTGDYSGVAGAWTLDDTAVSIGYGGFIFPATNGPALGASINLLGAVTTTNVQFGSTAGTNTFFANVKVSVTATGTGNTYLAMGNGVPGPHIVQFGALDGGNSTTTLGFDNRSGSVVIINGIADGNFTGAIINGGGSASNNVIKLGASVQTLSGTNLYSGLTLVSNGVLVINGSITGVGVKVEGGTLGGGGTILDAVNVDTGGTLAVGNTSLNALTISNTLTLGGNVTFNISKTGGTLAQNQILGTSNVLYGGALTVANITSDGSQLANGDAFQLFPSGTLSGAFASFNLPALPAGLSWDKSQLISNGSIQVITGTGVNPNPTNIVAMVSGNQLTLSWPADHTGWTLESQTNSLKGTWYPVSGSTTTDSMTFTVDRTLPAVYFRLVYQP
jgi:autotransporter-associated beta strand protein